MFHNFAPFVASPFETDVLAVRLQHHNKRFRIVLLAQVKVNFGQSQFLTIPTNLSTIRTLQQCHNDDVELAEDPLLRHGADTRGARRHPELQSRAAFPCSLQNCAGRSFSTRVPGANLASHLLLTSYSALKGLKLQLKLSLSNFSRFFR